MAPRAVTSQQAVSAVAGRQKTSKMLHPPQAAQHRPAGPRVPLVRKLIPLLLSSLSHSKSTDKTADDNQNLLVLDFVSSWEKGFPGKHSSVSTDMQTYPRPKCILPSHLAFIWPGRCSYYSNDTSHLKTVVKKWVHFGGKPPLSLWHFMPRREGKPHSSDLQKGRFVLCNLCHLGCFLTAPKLLHYSFKTRASFQS